jgi:LEA14-like dessication related protein
MKKILLFGGIALAGFGLYRYFRYQVNLALNYDYKLKDFKILDQVGDIIKVSAVFQINNKSAFEVEINSYDLELYFKDVLFARTTSNEKIVIQPNSSFEVTGYGEINLQETKTLLIPFAKDVLNRKPIDIAVTGTIRIKFLGIPTSINFNRQQFNYSVDLIEEYKLSGAYERLKLKYPKVFAFLGIQ